MDALDPMDHEKCLYGFAFLELGVANLYHTHIFATEETALVLLA